MKPLTPNTLLQNRYLTVQLIGKGGMGEVYLAVDQRLGSAIALKRTLFSDDEQFGNAFEREARTLARLRHPVLPKFSDHFTEDGTQYFVMEHISGEDISKRLELRGKPFPLNWILFWADQLLNTLTYLHTHEPPIVHRDIKPQNLKRKPRRVWSKPPKKTRITPTIIICSAVLIMFRDRLIMPSKPIKKVSD